MAAADASQESLEELVGRVLDVPTELVRSDLAFESIPQWDSLGHSNLMLALEQRYGLQIDEDRMVELTTIGAIRAFLGAAQGA